MDQPLLTFLKKHHACKEGVQLAHSLIKLGVDTPDKVWLYKELPHHYRLWMFSRVVDEKTLISFAVWASSETKLTAKADEAVKELSKLYYMPDGKSNTALCLWLANEITRLKWVEAWAELGKNLDYVAAKKDEKMLVGSSICYKVMEKEIIRQVAKMFEVVPEIE